MSIEQEFSKYSRVIKAKELSNLPIEDVPMDESIKVEPIGGPGYSYVNIRILMKTEILDEINVVSQHLQIRPDFAFALCLQQLGVNGLGLSPLMSTHDIDNMTTITPPPFGVDYSTEQDEVIDEELEQFIEGYENSLDNEEDDMEIDEDMEIDAVYLLHELPPEQLA